MGQPKEVSPYKFRYVEKVAKSKHDVLRAVERAMGAQMTEGTLSAEQREVFDAICRWYETDSSTQPVLTMGGYAGTGKSTLVSVLANKYIDDAIVFCAFTGKATSVLRTKLGEANLARTPEVQTLHSLIYQPISDQASGRVLEWKKRFHLDYDLIVVDEASMLTEELFDDLRSFGIPILAVGDHGQLPPISGSFNLMEKPHLRLEKIHRQAEDSPILALADFVRRVGQIPRLDNTPELQVVSSKYIDGICDSLFADASIEHGDLGLLCYSNRQRIELNEKARRARWGSDFTHAPIEGDQVICLRNEAGRIYNGMRGKLTSYKDSAVLHYSGVVLFEDDEVEVEGPICKVQFGLDRTIQDFKHFYQLTQYNVKSWQALGLLFDYGYALTGHKAQGSEFDHVVVDTELPHRLSLDEKRRWLYTAFTRASRYLCILQ